MIFYQNSNFIIIIKKEIIRRCSEFMPYCQQCFLHTNCFKCMDNYFLKKTSDSSSYHCSSCFEAGYFKENGILSYIHINHTYMYIVKINTLFWKKKLDLGVCSMCSTKFSNCVSCSASNCDSCLSGFYIDNGILNYLISEINKKFDVTLLC